MQINNVPLDMHRWRPSLPTGAHSQWAKNDCLALYFMFNHRTGANTTWQNARCHWWRPLLWEVVWRCVSHAALRILWFYVRYNFIFMPSAANLQLTFQDAVTFPPHQFTLFHEEILSGILTAQRCVDIFSLKLKIALSNTISVKST